MLNSLAQKSEKVAYFCICKMVTQNMQNGGDLNYVGPTCAKIGRCMFPS